MSLEVEWSHWHAVRTQTLKDYGAVETFRPQPDWIVPAVFTSLDGDTRTLPGQTSPVIGCVAFRLGGLDHSLLVTMLSRDGLHTAFSDTSREGLFPYRYVRMPDPDDRLETFIDFNRAVLPRAAFCAAQPAARLPKQNRLAIAIKAGEIGPLRTA